LVDSTSGSEREQTTVVALVEGQEMMPPKGMSEVGTGALAGALPGGGAARVGPGFAVVPSLPHGTMAVGAMDAFAARGVTSVVLALRAWSVVWRLTPGMVVAVRDHLDLAGDNPLVGLNEASPQFVHVDGVYRSAFRLLAAQEARRLGWHLREGTYARLASPLPPTSAQGRWLRALGVDLVGNQLVPQTLVAARAGLGVLALVVVVGWPGSNQASEAEGKGVRRAQTLLEALLPVLVSQA
jgi:purine nucleoside phosphorylase